MKRAMLVVTLMLAVGLAGCSGDDDKGTEIPQTGNTGTVDPGSLKAGMGAIQGIVIDDAYRPIPDALVLLQPIGKTLTTTINGEFAFIDVEPGSYTIRAEADGHEALGQTLQVTEGLISEVNVIARRIVNEGGSTITSEHSAFLPCSAAVLGPSTTYGCMDTSGDSYRPGIQAINFTGEEEATFLVVEMKTRREADFLLTVRHDDGTALGGDEYGRAATDRGDYAKVVLEVGNNTGGGVVWNNDKHLAALVFYQGEGSAPDQPIDAEVTTLNPRYTGVSVADKAQIVMTLFLGEPGVDPMTYCVLCE